MRMKDSTYTMVSPAEVLVNTSHNSFLRLRLEKLFNRGGASSAIGGDDSRICLGIAPETGKKCGSYKNVEIVPRGSPEK